MFYWIRSAPQSLLAKRPLVTLLLLETAACLVANLDVMQGRPRAALWSAIFVFTPYLWFLPYAIVDQRSRTPSPMLFQMAILRPFWSPSYLSFNKGAAFLNKHLAKTPNDLAVTQLKAVKLLLWANVFRTSAKLCASLALSSTRSSGFLPPVSRTGNSGTVSVRWLWLPHCWNS